MAKKSSNGVHKNGHKNGSSQKATLAKDPNPAGATEKSLSIKASLSGRHILMTGSTGFLGKVVASMMLHRHPDIGHLYLVIRPSGGRSAKARFEAEVSGSPVFNPLREVYTDGFDNFIEEKVTVLAGDVSRPLFGLSETTITALKPKLDLVLNSAGLTSFTPTLESAIGVNSYGPMNALALATFCDKAALAHVSTTYVTGRRDGFVRESENPYGFYPRQDELKITFDPDQEIKDCHEAIEAITRQAEDQKRRALFMRCAIERLEGQGRNPNDSEALEEAIEVEKKKWTKEAMREEGKRRADHWGWTNTYTYAKSLGEQLLSRARATMSTKPESERVGTVIIRPSIIESSLAYPFPGWNQGVNTSAPITFLLSKGVRFVPTRPNVKLDIVPVDLVAKGMLAVAAATIAGEQEPIYQIASSARNPCSVFRFVELTTLATRQHMATKTSTPRWKKILVNTLEGVPVTKEKYERISAPTIRKAASGLRGALRSFGPTGFSGLDTVIKGVSRTARQVEKQAILVESILDVFMPFTHDSLFVFEAEAIRRLCDKLPEEERDWGYNPEDLDWRYYWLDVQMPGLFKYVYPEFEEKLKAKKRDVYTPKDLLEVFHAAAENYKDKVALQQMTPTGLKRFTYAEFKDNAALIAHNLKAAGLKKGDRVLIMSENRPEWGMSYFGLLEAEATAVPVDAEISCLEVVNLVRSARAFGIILSNKVRKRLMDDGLEKALSIESLEVEFLGFDKLLESRDGAQPTALVVAEGVHRQDDVASLIFTSGTTGKPKGVMLAHRNFAALLSSMNQVFDITQKDTFLSVLPMHHTFEFTCGFLMPMSKGATVTYLEELSSESLNQAFNQSKVTAMIGVPALWQLLHRKIVSQVNDRGPVARTAFDALLSLNRWMRERFQMNMGHTLFGPVHKGFGGQIRYLISGGASLPAPIMETFHGLGFELLEGYGLTEAAPVLTCGRPGEGVRIGSVGKPLPGIEIDVRAPDGAGVGEIVARGGNVMLGYFDNKEATDSVLDEEGWLSTGDLGRIDKRGYVHISGRQKDVIVAANGENVYPDELEEVLEGCEFIEELSIVGLPDAQGSERVACAVRVLLPEDGSISEEEARAEVRKFLDLKAVRLAYHQRIKVLRFVNDPLPRTATRKVKRKEVVKLMQSAQANHHLEETDTGAVKEQWGEWSWLREAAANLAGKEVNEVSSGGSMVDDLGFDSLAFTELSATIEKRTGLKLTTDELLATGSLSEIIAKINSGPRQETQSEDDDTHAPHAEGFGHIQTSMRPQVARRGTTRPPTSFGKVFEIPEPMRIGLKQTLGQAQQRVYRDLFDMRIHGKAHIPFHTHAIVAANHCSHLDMGLVKSALSDWAPDLATLAASDYFFDNKAKRTYFGQLTNLVPVERSGSLETSMAGVARMIGQGNPLLLFPEGTRSTTGEIADFRPGLGYLVMKTRTGVLPIYLGGTYRALPKGAVVPKNRRLRVHIGELIPFEYFEEKTRGMSKRESYLEVSRLTKEAVRALKAGKRFLATEEEKALDKRNSKGQMLEGLFKSLGERFQLNQVDEQVSYYFSLGQDDDTKWTLVVNPERCSVIQGKPSGGADCVVKTSPEMFRKMITESYTPTFDEFTSGTIKTNDPGLLMAFQNVFGF
jgi:long-chain acyl-CoA synthetase